MKYRISIVTKVAFTLRTAPDDAGWHRPVPSGAAEIGHIDFNGGVHIPHDAARCRNGTAAEIELGPISAAICRTVVRQFAAQLCGNGTGRQIASTQ